mmetsp:Transcript_17030/g.24434  ORF Transcript_17030/g.24434 Transcript_17030/m.24434 type:complete len:228 (-) Transcript_17030:83-766(-)
MFYTRVKESTLAIHSCPSVSRVLLIFFDNDEDLLSSQLLCVELCMLLIDNTNYRRTRVLRFPVYSGSLVTCEFRNDLHQLCGYMDFVISFVSEENDLVHRDLICVSLVFRLWSLRLGFLFDFSRGRTTSNVRFRPSYLSFRFTYLYARRNHVRAHRLNSYIRLHPSYTLPRKNCTPNKSHAHHSPNSLKRFSPNNRKTTTTILPFYLPFSKYFSDKTTRPLESTRMF